MYLLLNVVNVLFESRLLYFTPSSESYTSKLVQTSSSALKIASGERLKAFFFATVLEEVVSGLCSSAPRGLQADNRKITEKVEQEKPQECIQWLLLGSFLIRIIADNPLISSLILSLCHWLSSDWRND